MHIYDANIFIRVVKSNGYSYARLVENYRDSTTGKTKQRVICNLCRLDPPDPKATALKTFRLRMKCDLWLKHNGQNLQSGQIADKFPNGMHNATLGDSSIKTSIYMIKEDKKTGP